MTRQSSRHKGNCFADHMGTKTVIPPAQAPRPWPAAGWRPGPYGVAMVGNQEGKPLPDLMQQSTSTKRITHDDYRRARG